MKHSSNRRHFFWTIVMGLLLATAIPATALAQGHGRGHGKGNDGGIGRNDGGIGRIGGIGWPTRNTTLSNHDRKCAKFKNCHDASEGRWDGRGPRGNRVGNILGRRWRNRDHAARNNFLRNRGRRVGRRVIDNR